MILALLALGLITAPPPPLTPVLVRVAKDRMLQQDRLRVTLENPGKKPVWIASHLTIERSVGDGTWTPVYRLRVTRACPAEPPKVERCVRLPASSTTTLAEWDWNTGGEDQCPPRRPGHRAFKGVHRVRAHPCETKGTAAERAKAPAQKLVTWE